MSLQTVLTEDRRGIVLRCLAEDTGYRLSERSLGVVLGHYGHQVGGDQVRQMMAWLEQAGLVRVEKLSDGGTELWMAVLTPAGLEVARGRSHVGVSRPGPR